MSTDPSSSDLRPRFQAAGAGQAVDRPASSAAYLCHSRRET
eukprot:CAMPEP_0203963722 /NCGR_PEP_ID=MMETSP0359-20131031/93620_1 /ASSEMBLY_ACC=CAM_ASM_000338 /TAXON_ID=268821 /ORGANISM="Scrippsiella Hangoei, Strain SHTV-5" /LENGTH=40 /DNA_ID= /DNA_START= /DNA_END= /DNA_ORIENTATION=